MKEPSCSSNGCSEILKIDKFLMKNSIKITLSQQDVINACVEIVTVKGRPFSALEDSDFKKLLNPICKLLGSNFSINRRNIQKHIKKAANNIREMIKNETKIKLVSIKFDCATRHQRSILGINIQYIKNE